jgi:hypothetical protein
MLTIQQLLKHHRIKIQSNISIDVKNKAPTTQPQPQSTQQPQPQTKSNVDILNLHESTAKID